MTRGLVRARRGDPDSAGPLDEALALAEPTGEMQRLGPVRSARAEAAWLAGRHERAAAEAQAVLEWRCAWHTLGTGRAGSGLTGVASRGWRPLTGSRATYRRPTVSRCRGDWAGAAAAWEALGCPYDAALALLDGDEPALRRALAICERLGARPAGALAARRLRSVGLMPFRVGRMPCTRANPANLTARELEILPSARAGLP